MCGRTACTLPPDVLCKACGNKSSDTGMYSPAEWISGIDGKEYTPSYNFAPTFYGPVMIAKKLIDNTADPTQRVIQPMLWGMIPPWHKGTPTKHKMTTNNCRIEGIAESKLYKGPLQKGRRCVALCDGFYEWKRPIGTMKSEKQPYFIYLPQPEGISIVEPETWESRVESLWSPEEGWKGPKPLTIAALFDTWKSEDGTLINSYSIATMDSNSAFSWIHERMPAILETEEDVNNWLDSARIPPKDAVSRLKASSILISHPVSVEVGNVKNQGKHLVVPVDLAKPKPLSGSGKLMAQWLKKGSPVKKEELKAFVSTVSEGVKRPLPGTVDKESGSENEKPSKIFKKEKN